ncbi:hypothetical protein F4778DRAFT_202103 [Xylariomycetidae sp. FL2044]|nr:hypothetical protein F4778DRAFT_202103 [Xylariomycetidae sp. FL2044]
MTTEPSNMRVGELRRRPLLPNCTQSTVVFLENMTPAPLNICVAELQRLHSVTQVKLSGIVQSRNEDDSSTTIIALSDGSSFEPVRARVPSRLASRVDDQVHPWSTVQILGRWDPAAALVTVDSLNVLGESPASNPLATGGALTNGTHPHLRLRAPWPALLMRVRSFAISALHSYFDSDPLSSNQLLKNEASGPFYHVHHPVITFTDAEGGAEVFPVLTQASKRATALQRDDFFGGRRYLTVTAAIHGEAFATGLGRVWMLAPCFRAERAHEDDDRHLAEFHMLEVAVNHVDRLGFFLSLCEDLVRDLTGRLSRSPIGRELLGAVGRDDDNTTSSITAEDLRARWEGVLVPGAWPRVSHAEAVRLMQTAEREGRASFETKPGPEVDLSTEHELFLLAHFGGRRPVFVTHYPTTIRLFSALQSPPPPPPPSAAQDQGQDHPQGVQTTESMDLLMPGIGEICSGGLREHRLQTLIEVMRRKDFFQHCDAREVDPKLGGRYPHLRPDESLDSLEWFADLRRWGTTPHGGFGIGFERLLKYLTGAESTREVVAFPRYFGGCEA